MIYHRSEEFLSPTTVDLPITRIFDNAAWEVFRALMAFETLLLKVPSLSVGDQDGRKAIGDLIWENHVARSGGWSEYDVIHAFHIFKPRSRNTTSSPSNPQKSNSLSILAETFFIRMQTFDIENPIRSHSVAYMRSVNILANLDR